MEVVRTKMGSKETGEEIKLGKEERRKVRGE
jgi:hypothetical protein